MVSGRSGHAVSPLTVKILVAGGFGVGKTTLINTVTEIQPLRTEERLTSRGVGIDDTTGVKAKTSTTVAMDFGRITLQDGLALYLFGTPGQERFSFMWKELAQGALGAVVLADTRRLDACFASVDFCERRRLPFIIGVNHFDDAPVHTPAELREALGCPPTVPIVAADVRDPESCKQLLITLVEYVLSLQNRRAS